MNLFSHRCITAINLPSYPKYKDLLKNNLVIALNILLLTMTSTALATTAQASESKLPAIQLATVCDLASIDDINNYYVSEKYDGIRAYWTGTQLLTRQGNTLIAPAWFTETLPATALDGELWLRRQSFSELSSIVRQQTPDNRWRKVSYLIFDRPEHAGMFYQRHNALIAWYKNSKQPQHIQHVNQRLFNDQASIVKRLEQLSDQGAEGLMLHHKSSYYSAARNPLLCKLKTYADAEATVIGYTPGKGKYKNMTGALIVQTESGMSFKLGSGLSDKQRRHPPKIGATVTYRYNGLSKNGLPRFARFLRLRKQY